ncbi:NAD(P)-dependent oxidoreductase [Tunturiibacter gelidoferens]|uniref:Putative NADH-flavin reductase n=1 Tax=Tunturiibacter lichenicola TaxID=2051959 RepID=A0A7Y9T2M7_9BACT|nr:NAD(P)H-binding protein [Edaphobacter lichenicola]NYF51341.1 putative NADH-flavin reductase [Edaphobacter lichenicola]
MRLMILGATGGIGRLLVSGALEAGHEVTAFVRSPEKVSQKSPRLRVIGGDLFDVQQMAVAVRESEVVISGFGPSTLRKTTLRRDFGHAVVQAMRVAGVRRLIHVTSAFLFSDAGAMVALFGGTLFHNVVKDHVRSEAEMMQPDLEWTMVRPPRLVNQTAKGRIREVAGHLPKGGTVISRGDVASFMLKEAAAPRYVRQIVGISD